MKTALIIIIIIIAILISNITVACQCPYHISPNVQTFNNTPSIFIGTLVKSHKLKKNGVMNEFIVTQWYKGKNQKNKIFVRDMHDVGACGLGELIIGMKYLVYAYGNDTSLFTSSCSGTTFVPRQGSPLDSIYFKWVKTSANVNIAFNIDTLFLNKAITLASQDGYHKFKYNNGIIMGEGTYLNGLPHGYWKYYFDDGKLQEEGNYILGLKDSIWAEYSNEIIPPYNHPLQRLVEYEDNEPTFWEISYLGNYPQKYDETYSQKGTDKWIHKIYHHNGKLRVVMTHGAIRINKNGRRELGYLNGPSKSYYENGVLQKEGEHYKGYETGVWKEYDKKGRIIKTRKELSKEEIDLKT